MRRAVLVLAALLAAACDRGGPIADGEIALRVSAPPAEVELAAGFPLTVVRVWSKDLEPDPWNDAALLPIVVRLEETTRREDSHHVEETRRFRAYAFEPGTVAVPAISFTAAPKSGGPARTATSDAATVKVKATLDPKTAGPPEIPDLLPEPRRWWPWAAGGLAALLLGSLFVRASIRRSRNAAEGALAPPLPHERALLRIRSLRERLPRTPEEIQAWHIEASSLVRDWVADDLAIPSLEMTTEELLASPQTIAALGPPRREALAAVLAPCDLVKFARQESTGAERERVVGAAERVVLAEEPAKAGRRPRPAKAGGPGPEQP